jgi:hypothetical protein
MTTPQTLAQASDSGAAVVALLIALGIVGLQIYLIYAIIATRQDVKLIRQWVQPGQAAGSRPSPKAQTYRALLVSVGDAPSTARLIRERGSESFSVSAVRRVGRGAVISSGLSQERAMSLKESLEAVGTVIELVPEG